MTYKELKSTATSPCSAVDSIILITMKGFKITTLSIEVSLCFSHLLQNKLQSFHFISIRS